MMIDITKNGLEKIEMPFDDDTDWLLLARWTNRSSGINLRYPGISRTFFQKANL